MRKPLTDGFTREIIAVSFDSKGNRVEKDFDSFSEEEKKKIRISNNQKSLAAAGFIKVENKLTAE